MSKLVLVVDDSSAVRMLLSDLLQGLGFRVAVAEDGVAACAWLETNGPADLSCLDWNMPRMDGLQLVKYIRSDAKYASMPILMCTSEVEMERVSLALDAGANEYIMKPFDRDAIGEKLTMMGVLE